MKKVFYGWWVLAAASLIHLWSAGTFYYSFTAFFNPIVDEFGWSYAATSFAASLRSVEGGIASPVVGFAADRYGARRLLVLGSLFSGVGFFLLSRIDSLWSYYLSFIFLSIGISMLCPVPGWTALANWFVAYRGMALGILSASIGLGGVLVYMVNGLIELVGWRQTLLLIGVGMWVIGIPASLVVRSRPEPYGLVPDGRQPLLSSTANGGSHTYGAYETEPDFTVRQALKTRAFWLLALVVTISTAVLNSLMVHIMPYLISERFDRHSAAIVASLLVMVSTFGRFGMGWLTNHILIQRLLALSLLLQAIGLFILGRTQTLWQAIAFTLLVGTGCGGVITLRLTMQADYFGRKAFGSIQGISMTIAIIGTMSFPFLAGLYYDLYGSYRATWLMMGAATLLTVPVAWKTRPPMRN